MTMDLRLHYAPDNASLCVRLALEEARLPYRTVLVDRAARGQKHPSYLAINPNGLIPTLETPQGPIFETGAILLWISENSDGLMPDPGTDGRAAALKWLFWLANTLHPAEHVLFYPDQYIDAHHEDLRARTRSRIGAALSLLDAAPDAPWLDVRASILGCYLAPMLRWAAIYGGATDWYDLGQWPRLKTFAEVFETRASVARVALAEGLGPTPFSNPILPNPPEGSAL
ncbi:glutathione S-transferase family protein [Loktanella sp. IMCC34160]|nr:glutathione S-transferase family protein [Loktanella sp. IMCC34160]RYG92363.1 glutathione S-transferase family protein [Loktanella sp. IMCC34160]